MTKMNPTESTRRGAGALPIASAAGRWAVLLATCALLGVSGWNDARVPAWLPGKFVAAVQNASASGKPVLMNVNYDDKHFTEEKTVTFGNFAGQYAFMLWQTGHKDFQPAN